MEGVNDLQSIFCTKENPMTGVLNSPETDRIKALCEKYGLRYHIAEGMLFVSTETGNWRLLHDGHTVEKVYHQSLLLPRVCKQRKGRFEYGYHRQHIEYTDLEDVLYYIYVHDHTAYYSYEKRHRNMDRLMSQAAVRSKGFSKCPNM